MLCVAYADGEAEQWPIPEHEAFDALRRRCAAVSGQAPSLAFRGLRAQPVWGPSDAGDAISSLRASLETAFPEIRAEVHQVLRMRDTPHADAANAPAPAPWGAQEEGLVRCGTWQKLELWSRGRRSTEVCSLLPTTAAIIACHSGTAVMLDAPGRCYLSLMMPHTHVAPHCGPTNHRLRLHLPIVLPAAQQGQPLGIRVGGSLLCWAAGETLVFDDSFTHSVEFDPEPDPEAESNGARVVLVVDLWHPQATRWFPERRRLRTRLE